MKAIVRNVLLACLISTFALFGAMGRRHVNPAATVVQTTPLITEARKETFTCLGIAFLAWAICFWRCAVINRRLNKERQFHQRFPNYRPDKL